MIPDGYESSHVTVMRPFRGEVLIVFSKPSTMFRIIVGTEHQFNDYCPSAIWQHEDYDKLLKALQEATTEAEAASIYTQLDRFKVRLPTCAPGTQITIDRKGTEGDFIMAIIGTEIWR